MKTKKLHQKRAATKLPPTQPTTKQRPIQNYLDPLSTSSLGGLKRFQENSRQQISRKEAEFILHQNDAYTLHRDRRKKFIRNPTIVIDSKVQVQADLMDMSKWSKANRHFKFILVVMDCFSKMLACEPIKQKSGRNVAAAFHSIFSRLGYYPLRLQVDKGELNICLVVSCTLHDVLF